VLIVIQQRNFNDPANKIVVIYDTGIRRKLNAIVSFFLRDIPPWVGPVHPDIR
jgi:hypothetical protein